METAEKAAGVDAIIKSVEKGIGERDEKKNSVRRAPKRKRKTAKATIEKKKAVAKKGEAKGKPKEQPKKPMKGEPVQYRGGMIYTDPPMNRYKVCFRKGEGIGACISKKKKDAWALALAKIDDAH